MERVGINWGANPDEWFASFRNIQLTDCITCEKWVGNEWQSLIDFTQTLSKEKGF